MSENVSIDESMIKFKGRSSLKQYLPKKPIKEDLKYGHWQILKMDTFTTLKSIKEKIVKEEAV